MGSLHKIVLPWQPRHTTSDFISQEEYYNYCIKIEYTMETSRRRRSFRLQAVEADRDDDGANSASDHSDDDASSKRKRRAKNETAPTRSLSQSSERRRMRSNIESTVATSKRRKHTAASKSELSVATHTEDSTMSTNRRQTRSLSNQIKLQSKTVTPSPVSTTGATKFSFASPTKTADDYYDSDEESCDGIPPGVINLYRDEEDEVDASGAGFKSPSNRRARTRRGRKQHQLQQQLEEWAHRHERPRTLATGGGTVFDSSTKESLTVDYIRTYGEDYRQYLRDTENLVNCDFVSYGKPSSMALETAYHNSNKRSKNNPVGSPESRRSTSSSSSFSTTSTSKVTPDHCSHEAWIDIDFLEESIHRDPDPHQAPENLRKMMAQPLLTPKMRCILVDWLIELSEHFEFAPETLHFAVTLVDRVLASGLCIPDEKPASNWSTGRRRPKSSLEDLEDAIRFNSDSYSDDDDESEDSRNYFIPRDRFQLLGVTCVWLACKIKERVPPKAEEIEYVADQMYSTEQITRMERRICNALKFTFLQARTPHEFLFEFMRASFAGCSPVQENQKLAARNLPASAIGVGLACDSVFRDMANYLLELGRLPYGPTSSAPSLLAAAAVYLARITLGIPRALRDADASSSNTDTRASLDPYYWTPTLAHYTGYDQETLKDTVVEIHKYHAAAEYSSLQSVFNKYKSKRYNRVALKNVVRLEDLGFP